MEKIGWVEKISKEEVLKEVGEKRSLVETVQRCQKKLLGHTLRSDCWLGTVIEGTGMLGQKTKRKEEEAMLDKLEAEFGCNQ